MGWMGCGERGWESGPGDSSALPTEEPVIDEMTSKQVTIGGKHRKKQNR